MYRNIIFLLMYHRHKLSDLILTTIGDQVRLKISYVYTETILGFREVYSEQTS
jgi:hypothetical protein